MTTGQLAHARRQMQRRIKAVLAQRRLETSAGVQRSPEHPDSGEPAPED